MDELLATIAELGLELHPDRINVVASRLGKIASVEQFAAIKSSFGPNADKQLVDRLSAAWRSAADVAPRDIAIALRGASSAAAAQERRGAVELAWTGPFTGQVPVRHTEQVLCEVIDAARRRLFLVSFVAYEVPSIATAFRGAVERNVEVSILLELSSEHGGKIKNHDSVKLMRDLLPSARLYAWDPECQVVQPRGAVHAKCAVADGEVAFITSANLTSAAMERNMELGVLVKGGSLPRELHQPRDALVSTQVIDLLDG